MRRRRLLLGALGTSMAVLAPAAAPRPGNAAQCGFVLGFKALRDLIPDIVGECLTDEYHNPATGDGLQGTTAWHGKGGLLVWRKADNWTAFTDGTNTWINGPGGLQKRPNTERFAWENDRPAATPTSAPRLARYSDPELEYSYPADWPLEASAYRLVHLAPRVAGNEPAGLSVRRAYRLGTEYPVYGYPGSPTRIARSADEYLDQIADALLTSQAHTIYEARLDRMVGGSPARVQRYKQYHGARDVAQLGNSIGLVAVVRKGQCVYFVQLWTRDRAAPEYVDLFDPILNSFVPKLGE